MPRHLAEVGFVLYALAGREIPRWPSALAIVIGVSGLVWVIPPSTRPALIVMVNVLGSLVLFVALSRRLVRAA